MTIAAMMLRSNSKIFTQITSILQFVLVNFGTGIHSKEQWCGAHSHTDVTFVKDE